MGMKPPTQAQVETWVRHMICDVMGQQATAEQVRKVATDIRKSFLEIKYPPESSLVEDRKWA